MGKTTRALGSTFTFMGACSVSGEMCRITAVNHR